MLKLMGKKILNNFTLKIFVYLNLCYYICCEYLKCFPRSSYKENFSDFGKVCQERVYLCIFRAGHTHICLSLVAWFAKSWCDPLFTPVDSQMY